MNANQIVLDGRKFGNVSDAAEFLARILVRNVRDGAIDADNSAEEAAEAIVGLAESDEPLGGFGAVPRSMAGAFREEVLIAVADRLRDGCAALIAR